MSYIVSKNKNCLNTSVTKSHCPTWWMKCVLRSKAKYIMPPVADWWPLTIKFPLYAKFELIILVNQSFQPMKNQSCYIDNVIKSLLSMVKFKLHILTFFSSVFYYCMLSAQKMLFSNNLDWSFIALRGLRSIKNMFLQKIE